MENLTIIPVNQPSGSWGSVNTSMYESFKEWLDFCMGKFNHSPTFKILLYSVNAQPSMIITGLDSQNEPTTEEKILYFIRYKSVPLDTEIKTEDQIPIL